MNKHIEKLIKLSTENPTLEIKFFISGELQEDDNSWFVGDITSLEVSDYVEYEDRVYNDIIEVKELIAQEVVCEDKEMSDENLNLLVDKEFEKLEVKKAIIVFIGI